MQSISSLLDRLREHAAWFARASEMRLLVVRASGDLRKPALQLLQGMEFHADNRRAWLVLEDGRTHADDGWKSRSACLVEQWERRRKAFAEEGVVLSEVFGPSAETQPVSPARAGLLDRLRPSVSASVPSLELEAFGRTVRWSAEHHRSLVAHD